MLSRKEIARAAACLYITGSWFRRQLIVYRPYICPFEELISKIPAGATILDVGCGDGLFLNLLAYFKKLNKGVGFDVRKDAVQNADQARTRLKKKNDIKFFTEPDFRKSKPQVYDVVSMVDVLHHVPVHAKREMLVQAAGCVKEGGIFLFKDIGRKPRWRALMNTLHDLVIARELVSYVPLDQMVEWMNSAGLHEVERKTINRLWYGHELVILRRPTKHQPLSS